MLSQGTEAQAQTDSGQIHPILSQSLSFPTCKLGAMGSEVLTFYGDFGEERQFWRESLDFLGWRVGGMSLGLAFLGLGRGAPTTSQSSMSLWGRSGSGPNVPAPEVECLAQATESPVPRAFSRGCRAPSPTSSTGAAKLCPLGLT